jgi:hypothetical protein
MSNIVDTVNNQYHLPIPLIQGAQGKYYVVDGQKYDEHFPQVWALNHQACSSDYAGRTVSGPKLCRNCRSYGSINGVFVFYCANCTKYVYNGERGGHILSSQDTTEGELWRQFPYMNCVTSDEIGDMKNPSTRSAINQKLEEYEEYDKYYLVKKK